MSLNLSSIINQTFDHSREEILVTGLIEKLGHETFKPGLDRLRPHFSCFQNDFKQKKIVTVGGTNGKGETCYVLYDMLTRAGKKVALWTSPHILSVRERFLLPSGPVSYDELEESFTWAFSHIGDSKLSYYEFLFLIFCRLAQKVDVDIILFEVGLGGRFDAVNIFDANICAITSISRDHEEILGRGLKKILFEKFGISRAHRPLVTALESSTLRNYCGELANEKKVNWIDLFANGNLAVQDDYRKRNLTLAKYLANLVTGDDFSNETEAKIPMKGRFEKMTRRNISFIFVGAHNLDGMRKMRDLLLAKNPESDSELLLSFSKRSDKDIEDCLNVWRETSVFEQIHVSTFEHFKSASKDLQRIWAKNHFESKMHWCADWKEYLLEKPLKKRINIYVAGSYYFIGEVQRFILSHSHFFIK